jgi:2-polyprenyl-3-methyl-5-hydroxy-6-metoxy-1,4-benzoquinol methylase
MISKGNASLESIDPNAPLRNTDLIRFLKQIASCHKGFRWFMTVYRPFISPCAELLALLRDGCTVYDIGCGGGVLLSLVARFKKSPRIGGHDVSAEAVKAARALVGAAAPPGIQVTIQCCPPDEELSIRGYDYVTVVDVIHHVPENIRKTFLERIFRSMDAGAHLLIKDIDGASMLRFFNRLHDLLIEGEAVHEPPADCIARQLKQLGFHVLLRTRKTMLWYPHFFILARKPTCSS